MNDKIVYVIQLLFSSIEHNIWIDYSDTLYSKSEALENLSKIVDEIKDKFPVKNFRVLELNQTQKTERVINEESSIN